MTSLDTAADFNLARHTDFVSTDAAELATHMDRCALGRGRFFTLQAGLESLHGMVSSRIVTVTAAVLALTILGLLVSAV